MQAVNTLLMLALFDLMLTLFNVNCVDMFDGSAVSAGNTLLTLFDVMSTLM